MGKGKQVPPGTGNPPSVLNTLEQALQQIKQIQVQLVDLKKTVKHIDCGKHKKKK
jgi:hypothetical protein